MSKVDRSPRDIVKGAITLFERMRGLEAIERYFSPEYIEHNPTIPGGGLSGFVQLLKDEGFDGSRPRDFAFHVHHIVSEGDLVFVHQHVTEPGSPTLVIMDLYRVEDGLIVEHWDVMQTMPDNPVNTKHTMI
jgi:predicted SnoaL-like aldol condensation-catalyzing enzyme